MFSSSARNAPLATADWVEDIWGASGGEAGAETGGVGGGSSESESPAATRNTLSQAVHLTCLPACAAGTAYSFPQLGQTASMSMG